MLQTYVRTPIFSAASNGHTKIVKILASFTENPNAPEEYGNFYCVACMGHTNNPNAPNGEDRKRTPSSVTKNTEIRRFLESFNTSKKRKMI